MREGPLFLSAPFAKGRQIGGDAHSAGEVDDSWCYSCCLACRDFLNRMDYSGYRRGSAGWGMKDFAGCRNCDLCCRYDLADHHFADHHSMGC